MRRLVLTLLAAALVVPIGTTAHAASPFSEVVAFSTKTGFRAVVAWQAETAVGSVVRWGEGPTDLPNVASSLAAPDRAGMAVVDGLTPGRTYWFAVEDRLTGQRSAPVAMQAGNAYNAWSGSAYTINLLVQLDLSEVPAIDASWDLNLDNIASAVDVAAERIYDALDGFARIGTVVVTDFTTDYPANAPFGSPVSVCPPAGGVADVLIETTIPFDSHTWTGFAIDTPCTMLYLGREGQLVVPWESELHTGYVASHELMHYAFNAPDLYGQGGAACWNPEWDGSMMSNRGGYSGGRWRGTEVERNEKITPCTMGNQPYTWDQLRERYENVPLRPDGPVERIVDTKPKGNPDGGALKIYVLRRSPAGSTLSKYTP